MPAIGAEIIVADRAWTRAIPGVVRVVARAAAACGTRATIVLGSDRAVRVLNRTHRGIDKPTNVLTFEPSFGEEAGDIILAYGTIAREAAAAGRPVRHHLAHLVMHGALHLQGHDHAGAGQAREMETTETRLLRRIGVPNPWQARR